MTEPECPEDLDDPAAELNDLPVDQSHESTEAQKQCEK
jgi:hypothetical protein